MITTRNAKSAELLNMEYEGAKRYLIESVQVKYRKYRCLWDVLCAKGTHTDHRMGTSIRSSAVLSTVFWHEFYPLISQMDQLDLGTHVLPEDHENHK